MTDRLERLLQQRFGTDFAAASQIESGVATALAGLAAHSSGRSYADRPVDEDLVKLLCACALSAPSKSDLQLRDIILVTDPAHRQALAELVPSATMLASAPVVLVFCGNAGRLVRLTQAKGLPFPNNHADLLVNAVADAAIALGWMQAAVNFAGLTGCAVSGIRDRAAEVSTLLDLPPFTLPFAAFALGWPAEGSDARLTPRLPLSLTLHRDRMRPEDDLAEVAAYDARRGAPKRLGWSEARARQYSVPLRENLGTFLQNSGFTLGLDQ